MTDRNKAHVRLVDIAGRVGLSSMAVSKALRDHPDMATDTVQRVKRVAAEMGYVPNHFARSLQSRGGSRLLGVVVPKIRHAFFAETLAAIQEAAAERGYEILVGVSQEEPEAERRHIETFLSMRVEGLLVSVSQRPGPDNDDYGWIHKQGVPLLYFDRAPRQRSGFQAVVMDDFGGAREAVLAAVAQGRGCIAHLAGYADTNIGAQRCAGYEAGLIAAGLPVDPDLIVEGGLGELDGYRGFQRLWAMSKRPDAIFCASFPIAVGVMDAMRALAPEDIGEVLLVFFGVRDMARFFPSPYICVVQPAAELGRLAVDQILRAIDGEVIEAKSPLSIELMTSNTPVRPSYLEEVESEHAIKGTLGV